MKIYLVRHTAVDVPAGMCYGHTDVSLKNTFEQEALLVRQSLKQIHTDAVFSSPLSRCVRLAIFCGFSTASLDSRLMELNFGDWEGRLWNEIDMSVWASDWMNPSAPNGESFVQMYQRVASFFDDLKKQPYKTILIFTHGGVINCARVHFKLANLQNAFELNPRYGEVFEFES